MDNKDFNPQDGNQEIREKLNTQVNSKGIEGVHNKLICFGNIPDFLQTQGYIIAWSALTGRLSTSRYCVFGLDHIDGPDLLAQIKSEPKFEIIRSYHAQGIFEKGTKDYLINFGRGNEYIAYCWLPSFDSTGSDRFYQNKLIARFPYNITEELIRTSEEKPQEVYDLLISSLYPSALIPLSEEKILSAVEKHSKEVIRLTTNQELAKEYRLRLSQPDLLISNVQPFSVLKRLAPCEKLQIVK